MNKTTTIMVAILAVIAILIAVVAISSGNDQPADVPQPQITEEASLDEQEQPTEETSQVEETIVAEAAPEAAENRATFEDIAYSILDGKLVVSGVIQDWETDAGLSGLTVELYCQDVPIGSGTTDGSGAFVTTAGDCASGSIVYLTVGYDGTTYQSDAVQLIRYSEHKRHFSSSSSIAAPSGVPEFSIATLAIAVIAGCLGLAFLRKE